MTETTTSSASSASSDAAQWLRVDELTPWDKNPRRNDGEPVDAVARSLQRFGFVAPIIVWRERQRMVAGHTRLKALRALLARPEELDDRGTVISGPRFTPRGAPAPGMARVVFHSFESEEQADLYALADNKLAELSKWDDDAVSELLAKFSDDEVSCVGFADELPVPDKLGDEVDAPVDAPRSVFGVIVECVDERSQVALLTRLTDEGLACRALM